MPDNSSWRWTWLMALLATAALEIAADDGESPRRVGVLLTAMVGIVLAGNWVVRHTTIGRIAAASRLSWVLGLAGGALAIEIVVRLATHNMLPLELLLLAGFRNAVLALAMFAHEPDAQRPCGVLSTFLMIFSSAVAAQLWLQGMVILFTVVGIWWLMASYWNSLAGRIAADSSRELPRQWLLVLPLLLAACLLLIPFGNGSLRALAGFMPSSGGTEWSSEVARSGVGDGDALVAGTEEIRSFAPIEDAPFLSSHEPSLYDLFDDSYDEAVKVKDSDRAISLPKELAANQKEHHLAQSQQAGRQFSTLREFSSSRQKRVKDRLSTALFYVKGRTPLHVKLQTFQAYDGVEWHPDTLAGKEASLEMETLHGRPWLRVPVAPGPDIYAAPESHAFQIVHLDTNRIPAPTQLLGIHIDLLDRADFYSWAQPGVLKMNREKLPAQTAIHVQSRCLDEDLVAASILVLNGRSDVYQQFGDDVDSLRVRELAQEWTRDVPHGWSQIAAVVQRLRKDYTLDRDVRPPPDCRNTVAQFLFEDRAGPDYQFASATVWLLRSLGYSCRVVSGFYVDPDDYDARSRQTPVSADDVHFWAEVYAGRDHWIPIEPTPGYQLLAPPLTWSEQAWSLVVLCVQGLLHNWWLFLLGVAIAAAVISCRKLLADTLETWLWRMTPSSNPRAFVRSTAKLLEARLRRLGAPKPRELTTSRWMQRRSQVYSSARPEVLHPMLQLVDWADYAPNDAVCPWESWRETCLQLEREWSWQTLVRQELPDTQTVKKPQTLPGASSWQSAKLPQIGSPE